MKPFGSVCVLSVLLAAVGSTGCGSSTRPPDPPCDGGKALSVCMSRNAMNDFARRECPKAERGKPLDLSTCRERSESEMKMLFTENGCLVQEEVFPTCKVAGDQGQRHDDGSCCYYVCSPSDCSDE